MPSSNFSDAGSSGFDSKFDQSNRGDFVRVKEEYSFSFDKSEEYAKILKVNTHPEILVSFLDGTKEVLYDDEVERVEDETEKRRAFIEWF